MKKIIITSLLLLSAFILKAQNYVPTDKIIEAAIVSCPDNGMQVSYKSLRGLRRCLRKINKEMGTNYPTKISGLKELALAANKYSNKTDHVYQIEYRVFTRYKKTSN
jgi:hypothetical protein